MQEPHYVGDFVMVFIVKELRMNTSENIIAAYHYFLHLRVSRLDGGTNEP